MSRPLLTTKLFLPPVRAERVERARLLAQLDGLLRPEARVALISAPAGFGKTSLLAEWLRRRGRPAAWLSLDAGDNAPDLFFAYLAAAVERARPGSLPGTGELLDAATPAPPEALVTSLVVELAALDPGDPLVIALDDFQFIHSTEARSAVERLVEHHLPGVRLVLSTRADPALPLPRLRARGQLVELRAADLRFTLAEGAEFLTASLGRSAEEEIAGPLVERTEGWAAGLQMAAVALRSTPGADPAAFVRSFSGSNRYVLDYLAEEVLSRLPEETVHFLLRTAPLERFCAGLCAAVEGGPEAAGQEGEARSQAMLEDLERANLFLVPLDAERRWFRYHHLFADLLRARAKQNPSTAPAETARRASLWFEQNGFLGEAIQYALAGKEYQHAARLVETHTVNLLVLGQLHSLEQWDRLLPGHLVEQRPWLSVYRAWLLNFAGRLADVSPLLVRAEQSAEHLPEEERRLVEGHTAAMRCYLALFSPQPWRVFECYREVEEKLPEGSWARGVAQWATGAALRAGGELEEARKTYAAMLLPKKDSDPWGYAMAATDLGIVLRLQGRLGESIRTLRGGLRFVEERGARRLGYTGRLITALAASLYEADDLAEARKYLEEAVALNETWRNPNHQVFAWLVLSRVEAAEGRFEAAGRLVEQAGQAARELPVLPSLAQSIRSTALALELAQGRVPPPSGALEEQIQSALNSPISAMKSEGQGEQRYDEAEESRRLLFARVLLAQRRPEDALRMLEGSAERARSTGRGLAQVEALALRALACYLRGAPGEGLAALGEAAGLAEPEGILRTLLDLEPLAPGALREMLLALGRAASKAAGAAGAAGAGKAFLARLPGAESPSTAPAAAASSPAAHPRFTPVEPLSERELEVLRLMAEGLTNLQIAARLVIAPGTVKAHTASIYRKLDAANRTQAVARAREAGITAGE